MNLGRRSSSIAQATVLSVLEVILAPVPASPFVGRPGVVPINVVIRPIQGMLLGPWIGALTSIVSGLMTFFLFPQTMFLGPLTIVANVVGTFCAGMVARGHQEVALGLSALYTFVWFTNPSYGFIFPYWMIPCFVLMALLVVMRFSPIRSLKEVISVKQAFVAVLMIASTGGWLETYTFTMFIMYVFYLPVSIYYAVLPVAVTVRIATIILCAVVGATILSSMKHLQSRS